MNTKFIVKRVNKYCKTKGISNYLYKDIITITTMFNVVKGEIKENKDIQVLINMMDVTIFSRLVQDDEYEENALREIAMNFAKQFSYPKTISKILLSYLDAYFAHIKVSRFEYFYNLGKVDKREQFLNVELFSDFLDASRKLNSAIIDGLKYNYSFIIEYARDSLKREE